MNNFEFPDALATGLAEFLPLKPIKKSPRLYQYPIEGPVIEMKKKILLAEDNLADVELVRISVNEVGKPVDLIHVGDGGDMIEYLSSLLLQENLSTVGIAAILLDLNMHRVSGIDVLKYINLHPKLKKIPVIVFTTSSSKSDINLCYDLGAKAFVCKPLDIFEFNDTIKAIMDFWVGINMLN